ncbi:MAG: flagellar biosynthesis protein FlgH [Gallionella sp.]|nr:MAG: flagellar biosynthesis protein FlgH [Gallionella sp.]
MARAVKFWLPGFLAVLAGCAGNPPTSVHQPMTAKPVEKKTVVPVDGAIFHAGINERPLFEDKRARNVGDILTINIAEKMTGSRKSSGSSSYSNSIDAKIPTMTTNIPDTLVRGIPVVGVPAAKLLNKLFSLTGSAVGETSNETSSKAAGSASEDLTGTIAVTVIDVLPNGNLLVSGEKQVALNQSDEFIRFSGVVNPTTISNLNAVQSTQVADAHIEYKNAGAMNEVINDARSLGFLGRFFLSVLPF